MTKVINKNLEKDAKNLTHSKAVRSMGKYIRTHGQYRSGLTTSTDGGALVPSEIVTTAEDLGTNQFQLKPYVNNVSVNTARGSYPVMNPTTSAHTKDELEKYPDLDNGINNIIFNVKSYAGKLTLSDELLDDASTNLMPMLSKNMSRVIVNTQNRIIAEKMATLDSTTVSSLDDVVKAVTQDVDPRFVKNIFVGQAAYGKLRTSYKDSTGRYLLNTNDNTICGVPVVVMPNLVGNSNDIFVGDLKSALTFFNRSNISINYPNNSLFAKSMAMVMRADCQVTYAPALKRLTLSDAGAAK